jgi:hypothetical protein
MIIMIPSVIISNDARRVNARPYRNNVVPFPVDSPARFLGFFSSLLLGGFGNLLSTICDSSHGDYSIVT